MENTENVQAIDIICQIAEQAKDCKMDKDNLVKLEPLLFQLSNLLAIKPKHGLWLSIAYMYSFKSEFIDLDDYARYLGCNVLNIVRHQNDFIEMESKNIFKVKKKSTPRRIDNFCYYLSEKTVDSIFSNKKFDFMDEVEEKSEINFIDFIEKFTDIYKELNDGNIYKFEAQVLAKELVENNLHFEILKSFSIANLSIQNISIFILLCWETLSRDDSPCLSKLLEKVYCNHSSVYKELQNVINKTNSLVKMDLIAEVPKRFVNDMEIILTDKAHELLEKENIKLAVNNVNTKDFVFHAAITKKKLLFNKEEQLQYELICKAILQNEFEKIQSRLTAKGLPKGITVLLHGEPGTGKTETVLQMAKTSERDIFKVDISASKSFWFGESQKIIKQIFTKYKKAKEASAICPILFINEADGLFSKRKDSNSSNVAQTENEIQNILLEELENFDGILFATTNLINNFDTAFDRRFLFKLHLPKPDLELRINLWKSKLKKLKTKDYELLAKNFNFSGGEIDNIVRKVEIMEILHNVKTPIETIVNFCHEDLMRKQTFGNKIGF